MCNVSGTTLSSQAQINNFGSTYSTCSSVRISGALTISSPDITDISPLSKIQYVGGRVLISNLPLLSSLAGLHNLDSTGADVSVFEAPLITDLSGLSSLKKVGVTQFGLSAIDVSYCDNLTSLNGLQNITRLSRLSLNSNPVLTNFSGLDNLEEVEETITLDQPEASGKTAGLINFVGLSSLRRIGGDFFIQRLSNIVDFTGLENLEFVGGLQITDVQSTAFSFSGLSSLTTVSGQINISSNPGLQLVDLSVLQSVGASTSSFNIPRFDITSNDALLSVEMPDDLVSVGNMNISQNPSLSSIAGLGNLTLLPDQNGNRSLSISSNESLSDLSGLKPVLDISELYLNFNPLLETCEVPLVCDYLSSGGSAIINNNASGCNSVAEVEAACLILPVTWQRFTAEAKDKGTELRWSTVQEENNAGFIVEHSRDGLAFQPIMYLRPRPQNPDGSHTYDWFHETTLGGAHYYRVRQEDLDGTAHYSEVRQVALEGEDDLVVYPTVVRNALTVEVPEPSQVRIVSAAGRLMARELLHPGKSTLDVSEWPSGVYFVQTNSGTAKRIIHQ